ncbi:MAG: terminase family protein [Mesorhizobium sp.]
MNQYPLWRYVEAGKDQWLVMGGRGAGKTRLGAEWVNALVRGLPPFAHTKYGALALVGETFNDVREVMVEGPSGIMATARGARPRFEASRRRLVWEETGAVAHLFSAEDPDSLRGPQFDAAWCDEIAKWRSLQGTFDVLQFGLRLGARPLQLWTTTPRPLPLIKRLMADERVFVTIMPTMENAANLAPGFIGAIEARYGGSQLARQELEGALVEDREDALWTRERIEQALGQEVGDLRRIVVAVDPPAGSGARSDACGIVAAGVDGQGRGVVLADATMNRATPGDWAARAIALYHSLGANFIVAEVNQGGEMVSSVLRSVDASVPVKPVRASVGKRARAEPVALFYEQGRVRHDRRFPELEDEMCDFGRDGLSGGRSPDRLDAMVWALTELMLGNRAEPRVRGL